MKTIYKGFVIIQKVGLFWTLGCGYKTLGKAKQSIDDFLYFTINY